VLLISGGGKGITAECALALAKESGARLALIGRADVDTDGELAANLKRFTAAGIEFRYVAADVTNRDEVRVALERMQEWLGPITGLLHGAARNEPQLLVGLEEESFRRTLAVKVQGALNLLAEIDPEKLKLLITFGSIISRTGLPGEADYGLANEWLTQVTEEWQAGHPMCRCLAVEWSIWSGKGMGERLSDTDRLMQQGITPISPDAGVSMLRKLLGQPNTPVSVVAMSRFSNLPTFKIDQPELPFLRFLEQPAVYYPGIELIVDVDLSTTSDPYLDDHVFQGERIFPAVMGLEAMAQTAAALTGLSRPHVFEKLKFDLPVIVPGTGSLKIRLAALAREDGSVAVALRSEATAFQVNHFETICRFAEAQPVDAHQPLAGVALAGHVELNPERDLYDGILFQRGRFRRISNYRLLKATECIAEIAPDETAAWFSQYLPGRLLMGDAGTRDATLHSIQACIPHKTLLPIAVERLSVSRPTTPGALTVHARERSSDGDIFVYDIDVRGADGCLRERWDGLRLKAVGQAPFNGPWVESLLGPYIERRVHELIPRAAISVALLRDKKGERRVRSDRAIQMALGNDVPVFRRPDGKPEVDSGVTVSSSHAGELTLAAAGPGLISCDIEPAVARSESEWIALLGESRFAQAQFLSGYTNDSQSEAGTRVWTASECLRKVGAGIDTPLGFVSASEEGWVLLSAGDRRIATYAASLHGQEARLILAIAA
jgi:enediyne polyketide synthase